MSHEIIDVAVIGGGINGAAIAADAAGRGLNVMLCEQGDLASGTSSWSTKLIHGGLRYLENYEFSMVRKALQERDILIQRAPHLIQPLSFIIPHQPHLRPAWMIQLGLWFYDHLAKRQHIPRSRRVKLNEHPAGLPLQQSHPIGFEYFDGQTDDCRLVIANALCAFENGASILTHTRCQQATRRESLWELELIDQISQTQTIVGAKAVINASGPWMNGTLKSTFNHTHHQRVTLIKGSHLVVKSLYDHPHAYLLQTEENRIVFAIPYQQHFTLIGTTDVNFDGSPDRVNIDPKETEYLLNLVNHYFKRTLTTDDIAWSFSGVRPLYRSTEDNASKISREHHIEVQTQQHLPLINVFGGKLTSHRQLAQEVVNLLPPFFPRIKAPWTHRQPLPGGNLKHTSLQDNINEFQQAFPWLQPNVLSHYVTHYGTRIKNVLQQCNSIEDLGEHFGSTLYAVEIDYLLSNEWAICAEDILWRRTKYGLHLTAAEIDQVKHYLNETSA